MNKIKKQNFFTETRLVFASREKPEASNSNEKILQPGQSPTPKPLQAQSSDERKFTAENLFKQYNQSSDDQDKRSIIAQLKQVATLENKDVQGVFTLSMIEARAWFEKNNLLPTTRDRLNRHLSASESQLRTMFKQSTISAIKLINKVVDKERYKTTVQNLVENSGQEMAVALETAAKALRHHQEMRDTIALNPQLQQQFTAELAKYRQNTTKPHWGEEFQILKKYHQLAKKEKTNQGPENSEILVTLGKLDRFMIRAGAPKVLRTPVEGRWVNSASTRKVARAFFANKGKISPRYAEYLTKAFNTSQNSRIITLQIFIDEAKQIGDTSLVSALKVRLQGLEDQGLTAIDDNLKSKMTPDEVKLLYANFKNAKYLSYALSTDIDGLARTTLEKNRLPSGDQIKIVQQLLNGFPQIRNHLLSTHLTPSEATAFTQGTGDLPQLYMKIISGFNRAQNSNSMPPLLALVKNYTGAIESTAVMAETVGNIRKYRSSLHAQSGEVTS